MGHKTQNLSNAENQFIVNIEGISATENDGKALLENVDEAKDNTELSPQKVLTDGQYTTVANFHDEPLPPSRGYSFLANVRFLFYSFLEISSKSLQ